jgi:hypothetical protein
MRIGLLIAASAIALSSTSLHALSAKTCNMYMDYYQKYLNKYVQDTKTNATTHAKKTDSSMAKQYQDKLLEGCQGVINLREVERNKYRIDTAYRIYQ